jgi:hypothetical protein
MTMSNVPWGWLIPLQLATLIFSPAIEIFLIYFATV